MKKAITIIMICLLLTGCGINSEHEEYHFKTISTERHGYIVYDTRTGVEYWISNSTYNPGSLTLLVDKDGKPLIYEE